MPQSSKFKKYFPRHGKIEWIGIRGPSDEQITSVCSAELVRDLGIVGDKECSNPGSNRQVTLVQHEYFAVIASFLGGKSVTPYHLRRNIVVSGLNLAVLSGYRVGINEVVIQVTGNCAPCAKLERTLGYGGYNAVCNHGGVTAVVLKGGKIGTGDEVEVFVD